MASRGWSPAFSRYQGRVAVASVLYVAALLAATWVFAHAPPRGAPAYAVAVLPALPVLGVFLSLALYLREEADEYQRQLMVRQILVATAGALIVATVYGFLESFVGVPHLPAYWVAVVWFFFFGVGRCLRGRL